MPHPIRLPNSEVGRGMASLADQVIRQSPIGIAVIDQAGLHLSVNPAYCAIHGHAAADMLGRSFTMVFPPAQHDRLLGLHREYMAQGGELRREWQVVRGDGSMVDVLAESVRVADDDGRFCRLIYVTDISALKQTQEALRRREALQLDLAASIPGAMFRLGRTDTDPWRFTYMSPGIEALFGVTPEEACSRFRPLRHRILPEDLARHDETVREAIHHGVNWEHEYRIRMPDGQVKWIHAKADRKRDEHGDDVWTGTLSDISDRKRMEAVLRTSEETYRTLFETVPQGVVYQDATGRIISANPAAERILGLTLAQLQGRSSIDPHWRAVHEDGSDFPGDQHPAMVALRTGQQVKDVVMGVTLSEKGQVWILVSAMPLFRNGQLEQVYATFEDITERMLLSNELRRQAATDDLTGVANRRSLMARLGHEFHRIGRHPEMQCAVLALDLDLFKHVNDSRGHAAGDAVLVHVSNLMKEATRQNDLVGRSGGEEFTVLLPDTGAADAMALAERLRQRIATTPVQHAGQLIPITVSIGLSVITADDDSLDSVLARADQALYRAKHEGRNRVHCKLTAAPDQGD